MHWLPKSSLGKFSFLASACAFLIVFIQYWIAMLLHASIIFPGFIAVMLLCIAGITSAIAFVKYRDHAILLVISVLLGLFGWLLVIGELLFPH